MVPGNTLKNIHVLFFESSKLLEKNSISIVCISKSKHNLHTTKLTLSFSRPQDCEEMSTDSRILLLLPKEALCLLLVTLLFLAYMDILPVGLSMCHMCA